MTPQEFYARKGSPWGYSPGYDGFHTGQDYPWGARTPIPCFGPGRVVAKGENSIHGHWISIIIGGVYFHFCHLVEESHLEVGAQVGFGSIVGLVGSTGLSTGAHLHLAASNYPTPGTGTRRDPVPLVAAWLAESSGGNTRPIEEEEDMRDHILLEISNRDGSTQWALVSPDLGRFVPIWKVDTANNLSRRISDGTGLKSGITNVARDEWNGFREAAGLAPDPSVG